MSTPSHPILIGTSGWSYPDWEGSFYPVGLPSEEFLVRYADRFPAVEVDSTFYRVPTAAMVRAWRSRTPENFRFVLKVPRNITHERQLRDCRDEVDAFVASTEPLGPKRAAALLQMGFFNRGAFATQAEFLERLDGFLGDWPHARVPLAVEIRNPRWVDDALMALLRGHGAAFTLTEQTWMPGPRELLDRLDPVTGPFAMVRLLGDRDSIEKIATTWDRIVVDRSADLERTAGVIAELSRRVPVFVFVSNHYAGHSPETARQLRRLLGLPEPEPPERPRTTLFD